MSKESQNHDLVGQHIPVQVCCEEVPSPLLPGPCLYLVLAISSEQAPEMNISYRIRDKINDFLVDMHRCYIHISF